MSARITAEDATQLKMACYLAQTNLYSEGLNLPNESIERTRVMDAAHRLSILADLFLHMEEVGCWLIDADELRAASGHAVELIGAWRAVERGIVDFDLHADAVARLRAAEAAFTDDELALLARIAEAGGR